MTELKKEFPVLNNYTYLNTASCGLISQELVGWRAQHDKSLLEGGSVFRDTHKPHIERIRSTVGRFFNASEDSVTLIPNFTFGFNILLDGLPKGLKVLLLETDYPSINWAVENRDFDVCYASSEGILEENLNKAIAEHQPDVLALSIVQYLSGIKIDFDFLKQLKAYHPEMLIIGDGTQYLGVETFDFTNSPFDVVGASTYKWLLAGYGNGLMMVKPEAQDKIFPKSIGFNSADAVYSNYENISFVKRFEPGHQDTLSYGSLEQAILSIEARGMEVISEEIKEISRKAKAAFSELGLLDDTVMNRKNHSSIFNIRGDSALFQKLKENNIICSLRGKGIRVSFHFYNTEADLDHLATILKGSL